MPGRSAACNNDQTMQDSTTSRLSEPGTASGAVQGMRREHVPLAIFYMNVATFVFAASSAASKWLVQSYPIGEVLFTRTLVSLIVCCIFILPHTGLAVFRTQRLRHHFLRSASQGISQSFLLFAFTMMPLAGAIAINFSAPLFATLASALVLKEPVGAARWTALVVGFCGVRSMTRTESAETLTLYQLALLTTFFALFLPWTWTVPTASDAVWIALNGASNAIRQYLWTRALHLAPASAVAPFYYLSLVWASILGFLVWGEMP